MSSEETDTLGTPSGGEGGSRSPASPRPKNTLLNVLKTASKTHAKPDIPVIYEIDASRPLLAPHIRKSEEAPSLKKEIKVDPGQRSLAVAYDEGFVASIREYSEEMVKKGRFFEEMERPNFFKEILFAYCNPKEKHLGKAAKKFAHQGERRSLNSLKMKHPDLGVEKEFIIKECHRQRLQGLIRDAVQNLMLPISRNYALNCLLKNSSLLAMCFTISK